MKLIKSLKRVLGKAKFDIKYKLGKAEEGKDFFSCGCYDFCNTCTGNNKPCNKILGSI